MTHLDQVIRRFNQQVIKIQPDGYILQGTVVERYLKRRVAGALRRYGPYYLWTRKIDNKTKTQALTKEQAKIVQQAIHRNRQLELSLNDLRSLSEQIIWDITPCVARRKRTI
jgi:asparagine synthetase B (glutamine-hydrolysing)